jgi:hypothetical protein
MAGNNLPREEKRNLTVKIDVDVSDALTGLKAIQREARNAVQALRELEAKTAELKRDDLTLTKKQAEVLSEFSADVAEVAKLIREQRRDRR